MMPFVYCICSTGQKFEFGALVGNDVKELHWGKGEWKFAPVFNLYSKKKKRL